VDLDDLVGDQLAANQPYDGLVAEAYDVWLSPNKDYSDVGLYQHSIEKGKGPALELGCGNGRLLVKYLQAGLDVEGTDASADMLAICAANARAVGCEATLHCADWVTLDLGKQYATLYNPAGSFALLPGDDAATQALMAWRAHLRPGGRLYVSMGVPPEEKGQPYTWRVRRSGTRAIDGLTFMVHDAHRRDAKNQVTRVLNRHEVWDAEGNLVKTYMRRHEIRWWTRDQMHAMFKTAGYTDIHSEAEAADFIIRGSTVGT